MREGLLKHIGSSHNQSFEFKRSGLGPQIYASHNFLGNTDAVDSRTTSWDPLLHEKPSKFIAQEKNVIEAVFLEKLIYKYYIETTRRRWTDL